MRVLLVEDDKNLNHSLTFQLEKAGFEVDSYFDGEEAVYMIEQNIHDVVLLDRLLPGLDGLSVLTHIRKAGNMTPVILITAMGTLDDKITGLDMGADDYLVKPFAFEEMTARIRCVTRRPHSMVPHDSLTFGDITWRAENNSLTCSNETCSLSRKEGALLEALLRNSGQTITRATLLTKVWGMESDVEEGNLDNYIHFLRRRLRTVGSTHKIKTVRSIGYRIE